MELDRLFEAIQSVRRRCPEVPLVAVHWMQIKHPVHAVHRQLLARASAGNRRAPFPGASRAARALFSLAYAAYFTLRLAQIKLRHAGARRNLERQPFDVVAKTWRFPDSREGEDFYYGDLQRKLQAKGTRMLLLYSYPRGRAWEKPSVKPQPGNRELHELSLLPLSAPLKLVFWQWRTSLRLGRIAQESQGLEALVAEQAMRDCVSYRHLLAGLSYWVFRKASEIWKPKAVLALYEGHAWEQLAWTAAKEVDPSCKTIGYQHTILLPHQLSLLRPSQGEFAGAKPDIVLCLGPRTERMLKPGHPGSRLIPFGTFRKTAQAPERSSPTPERKTVLVLPEAHREEMDLLFKTALQAAEMLPDHRFILRCHPILPDPLEQILSSVRRDPRSLPNVEISLNSSIEKDFGRSSALLYRGSSSVLYAVRYGLKPIYLRNGAGTELDSLFELRAWKEEVGAAGSLAESLRRYAGADPSALESEWNVASEFVRSYAIAVEDSSLARLQEALA